MEESLPQEIRKFIKINQLLGIFPYKRVRHRLKLSFWCTLWCITIISLFLSAIIYILIFPPKASKEDVLDIFVDLILEIPLFGVLVTSFLCQIGRRSSFEKLFSSFCEIKNKLGPPTSYNNKYLIVVISLILFLVFFQIGFSVTDDEYLFIGVIYIFLGLYSCLIVMQFTSAVSFLSDYFKMNMESFEKNEENIQESLVVNHILISSCKILNECYGPQILAVIVSGFLINIFDICYAVVYNDIIERINVGIWTTIISFLFFIIIFKCESLSDQADKFIGVVEKSILTKKTAILTPQLQVFLSGRPDVKFSACGFFQINYKLITSLVAANLTYLMIMLQLYEEKEKKEMEGPIEYPENDTWRNHSNFIG